MSAVPANGNATMTVGGVFSTMPAAMSAVLCALVGIVMLLPRPELGAACLLFLVASYMLLQHYATPPAAVALPSAAAAADLADLVASKLAAGKIASGASGEEVLAALAATEEAQQKAREW